VPIFSRRSPPPPAPSTYRGYRLHVAEDFSGCCAYCLLPHFLLGGPESFELDHFYPQSRFPEKIEDFYNLYYACHVCNRYKSGRWPSTEVLAAGGGFVDTCSDAFDDHWADTSGTWRHHSPRGGYTAEKLRLNRPHLVELRTKIDQLASLRGMPAVNWNQPSWAQLLRILS
jgi:hypothetical protein